MERRPGPEDAGPSVLRHTDLPLAPKVSQIDAEDLDESLVGMLSERIEQSLGNFKASYAIDLKPEIGLLLKLMIFRYTILDSLASPGAKLQNLKLGSATQRRPSRKTLLLYLLLHPPIFPSYILTRFRMYALSHQWPDLPSRQWRRKIWKGIIRLEAAAKAWELTGWLWFLYDETYPSLLMRILRLRLVPASSHVVRLVSYEFMNRQLVWSAFTEFLVYFIPLLPSLPSYLSPASLVAQARTLLNRQQINYDTVPLLEIPKSEASSLAHSGRLASLPKDTCPICHLNLSTKPIPLSETEAGQAITLPPIRTLDDASEEVEEETRIHIPAEGDCWGRCTYCYYCIQGELVKSKMENENKQPAGKKAAEGEKLAWECLRCGGSINKAWRVA